LPILKYSLIWRRDETRKLVTLVKKLVHEEVNFTKPNTLWSD
jgi:hypothetical protein